MLIQESFGLPKNLAYKDSKQNVSSSFRKFLEKHSRNVVTNFKLNTFKIHVG